MSEATTLLTPGYPAAALRRVGGRARALLGAQTELFECRQPNKGTGAGRAGPEAEMLVMALGRRVRWEQGLACERLAASDATQACAGRQGDALPAVAGSQAP